MNGRRELTAAVVGSVLAGALALSAGGQAWATVTAQREAPLPPVTGLLTGADAAPLVPAAGLVLLAAAVALLAVRGPGRAVVGLLMAVAGGVLAWSGVRALTGGLDDVAAQEFPGRTAVTAEISAAWPILAVLAGVLGIAAGLFAVLRGRTWPAMGRRYERPGTERVQAAAPRPETDDDRAQAAWKALDRGEDPTDPAPAADRP
ncbi:TIGR02234 family membrane protein [Blastococcus sp. CT_GayMR16]|uniref:TIGR02234 family membrane protein n=1 Tax=Blastococcus sp. CT_GayMR16 TaxID=2559607 RepID=UPI001073AB8E|nr:TIGR02234 family membrane protein [Blastococcus sp. CT_GayMR16]TFV87581.1 TIGR02234 family membrane protein [Blastococcus sp. CT_GayMR16]